MSKKTIDNNNLQEILKNTLNKSIKIKKTIEKTKVKKVSKKEQVKELLEKYGILEEYNLIMNNKYL